MLSSYFLDVFNILKSLSLGRLLTARSHSDPNQGKKIGVPSQYWIFGPETA